MENLRMETGEGWALASYAGELTSEVIPVFRRELEKASAGKECRTLALELSRVTFLDSSGIGFLVALGSRLAHAGKSLCLLTPSVQVLKTLELVQLLTYFKVLPRREDFPEAL